MKRLIFGAFVLVLAPTAFASWTEQFTISQLYVADETNMHYRVYGSAPRTDCPADPGWGYVSATDSGAKVKMADLLMAYLSGKQVSLNLQAANYFGDGRMFCHISEVKVYN